MSDNPLVDLSIEFSVAVVNTADNIQDDVINHYKGSDGNIKFFGKNNGHNFNTINSTAIANCQTTSYT